MGAARNPNAMFANREHTPQRAAQKAVNGHRNAKPGRARYGSAAFLQRHLGNRRFQQLTAPGRPVLQRACACGGTCAHCSSGHDDEARVQTKLTVGPPNDRYEQEADHVADQVMRMPEPRVQRQAAVEEEPDEDMLQMKPLGAQITPLVQRKTGTQQGTLAPSSMRGVLRSSGRPLGASTRSFMEPRFGVDFGSVRLHTGAGAERAAAQLQARAFTYGQDIWLGRGASESDRRLMAHELTHVVQQGAAPSTHPGSPAGASRNATGSRLQRARLPCTTRTTLDVYAVDLPGASRTISNDITTANSILCQCGIELNLVGGESWQTNLMDTLNPNGVLNEYTSVGNPTTEEQAMLAHQPQSGALHIYGVPSLSQGSLAEAFWPSGFPTVNRGVAVSNAAPSFALAHELGHVLLDAGGHHSNRDNLMAAGSVNSGAGELEQSQCNRMP